MDDAVRTILAGSRSIEDFEHMDAAVRESGFKISLVISGGAEGGDRLGQIWANRNGVRWVRFLPDWYVRGRFDRGAGKKRNIRMIDEGGAEALVAVWDGMSGGTAHMIATALTRGLKIYVKLV